MDALLRPRQKAHIDLAKVVLREFAGEALEADQWAWGLWSDRLNQIVECTFAAWIAGQFGAPEDLDRQERGILREQLHNQRPKGLRSGQPPNPASSPFAGVVDVADVRLTLDPTHASDRDVGERGDVALPVAGCSEYLNRVPLEHVDHPFPRCLKQRVSPGVGLAQSGQNFRKGCGQNFRNPQAVLHQFLLVTSPSLQSRGH